MVPTLHSPRTFQVWLYTVSHAQLLLRANPTAGDGERIEVLFKDVESLSLRTRLDGLTIIEEVGDPSATGARRAFRLESGDYSGSIIAGAVFVHRDRESYHAPSGFADSLPLGAS